ncbi:DEAD/DEAH box helicase [Kordiimonas pumila]|uniref:DEAD/DEAH box helicase n=1 Tax=Kordiimonas pumila TaxID=2161677 RepID=A0ABV7D0G5_9PROT|nr:DEAD/DEAH box helicase [Kordiimonas pumila]
MKNFNDLGLAEAILRAVSAEGYTDPTPIQSSVIPALLDNSDVIGIAQTGTGKTASFVLPSLHKILVDKKPVAPKTCRVLILVPTRELAAQIGDSIKAYGKFMKYTSAVIVGGVKMGPQVAALTRGVDILVATPGRLEDHMGSGNLRLDKIETIILDEADQMLDLGFVPAIRRVMAKSPKDRQTVLLSATMPKQIRSLAQDFLRNPQEISVAQVSKPIDRIEQKLIHVAKENKRRLLAETLSDKDVKCAIVFTRTKHGANKVVEYLEKSGIASAAIHGNKSQAHRQRTLAGFRSGAIKTLVATDIAARGIDVDGVTHVINFELPNVPEVYVHRIGRTARAGSTGVAIAFCDGSEQGFLKDIEKLIGYKISASGTPLAPEAQPKQNTQGRRGGGGGQKQPGNQSARPKQRRPRRKGAAASANGPARLGHERGTDTATAGLSRMLNSDKRGRNGAKKAVATSR